MTNKLLAICTLIVGFGLGVLVATPDNGALLPCATEDSHNCYWDADTRGNGEGNDFVVIGR